jgi:hypothetical protein
LTTEPILKPLAYRPRQRLAVAACISAEVEVDR